MSFKILNADVVEGLRSLPDASVHVVVTSPPYLALRRYAGRAGRTWEDGSTGVFGEETNLHLYVQHSVEIFRELKRVLHPSGTFWLNLGDSYQHGGPQPSTGIHMRNGVPLPSDYKRDKTFKSKKQLGMIPARVAIALQEDGWILRQDIIWAKGLSFCPSYSGSVMPESIVDRAIWSHEHLFQFALADRYFYDIDGMREPYAASTLRDADRGYNGQGRKDYEGAGVQNPSDTKRRVLDSVSVGIGRNLRNVWVIPKEPLKEAHFAAFPTKLVEPVVKLGSSEKGCCPTCLAPWGRNLIREKVPEDVQAAFEAARVATVNDTGRTDGHTQRKPNYRRKILGEGWLPGCRCEENLPIPCTVLDPFSGSGRAGIVAVRLGRDFIGIDASEEYVRMASRLIQEEEDKCRTDELRGGGVLNAEDLLIMPTT